jgi:hypothetical protein
LACLSFGLEEALHNLVLALLLGMGAALLASVGAWRLSRHFAAAASRL